MSLNLVAYKVVSTDKSTLISDLSFRHRKLLTKKREGHDEIKVSHLTSYIQTYELVYHGLSQ
jgi:hypothetical protein